MTIQTVANNLRNTIAGKEKLLGELRARTGVKRDSVDHIVFVASIEFLKVNINELKQILKDVESCVEEVESLKDDLSETNGRVRQLERQASDSSWITNPDRQGGGGWTQDELDPNRGWK